MQLVTSYEMFG